MTPDLTANDFVARLRKLADKAMRVHPDEDEGVQVIDIFTSITQMADEFDQLVNSPPGCTCHVVDEHGANFLAYADDCFYHGQWCRKIEGARRDFAHAKSRLVNEVRLELIRAALTGTAILDSTDIQTKFLVGRAIEIADETIKQLEDEEK